MPESIKNASRSPWKQLLQNHQFCWLFAGNTTLFMAFGASILLRSVLAWELTEDEMGLAYINLVTAVGMLSMSIVSGAIIDRVERRRLMLIAQSIIFLSEIFIVVLLFMQKLNFEYLMLTALISSFTYPFIMPARTAMMVEAIDRGLVGKATALMSGGANVARMISPAIVGIVADLANNFYAYLALVIFHATSLIGIFFLKQSWPEKSAGTTFIGDIKEGFVYLNENRLLALCILFGLLPILIVVPLQNLLVVFVDQIWEQGGSGLGILMGAMGIGGLLGSIFMAMSKEGSLVKPMIVATLLLSGFLLAFSHSPFFWLAVVLMLGIYACSVLVQSLVQTAIQLMTEDRVRGRITTMTLMTYGLAPMGTIPLAFAAKHIGAPWAMTWGAVLLIIVVLAIWFFVPSFRHIDEEAKLIKN